MLGHGPVCQQRLLHLCAYWEAWVEGGLGVLEDYTNVLAPNCPQSLGITVQKVLAVQEDARLPGIVLSRSHPRFVAELFKMEVPELAEGIIEIKSIAREPGNRTKIAVISKEEGVDPVGALVGQRGTRVMAVNNELGNEKIDIAEWSDDPEKFIGNSLSPAKVQKVEILPRREARVYVPEDQLSLAIGKGGQNVRLAAKLTGWKIDVRSQARPEEAQEGGTAGSVEAVAEDNSGDGVN